MRRIKFRGMYVDTNEFVYGSLILMKDPKIKVIFDATTNIHYRVSAGTIGQFVHTINHIDIYKGDISTLCSRGLYICKWSDRYSAFMWEEKDLGCVEGDIDDGENMVYFAGESVVAKIIGNIYENPELLKED